MKRPRGRCSRCWESHCLTKAGNVYWHKTTFYYPGDPARYIACDGAGKPPLKQPHRQGANPAAHNK